MLYVTLSHFRLQVYEGSDLNPTNCGSLTFTLKMDGRLPTVSGGLWPVSTAKFTNASPSRVATVPLELVISCFEAAALGVVTCTMFIRSAVFTTSCFWPAAAKPHIVRHSCWLSVSPGLVLPKKLEIW